MRHQTKCSKTETLSVVSTCATCVPFIHTPSLGVNPHGLRANDIWQTDVTHITTLGARHYLHVSVDTYSGMISATLHAREKTRHVVDHLMAFFASLGVPKQLKTDNDPAYSSRQFQQFCTQWEIQHKTGIPYNPQGQAIVERAHQHIKTYLQKTREHEIYQGCQGPQALLSITLFTLNFLLLDEHGHSATQQLSSIFLSQRALKPW